MEVRSLLERREVSRGAKIRYAPHILPGIINQNSIREIQGSSRILPKNKFPDWGQYAEEALEALASDVALNLSSFLRS